MKHSELVRIVQAAVQAGADKALADNDLQKSWLTKADAYRIYGRNNVDRWIREKLIASEHSEGKRHKKIIEKTRLDAVAATSNRVTYLSVADRKS